MQLRHYLRNSRCFRDRNRAFKSLVGRQSSDSVCLIFLWVYFFGWISPMIDFFTKRAQLQLWCTFNSRWGFVFSFLDDNWDWLLVLETWCWWCLYTCMEGVWMSTSFDILNHNWRTEYTYNWTDGRFSKHVLKVLDVNPLGYQVVSHITSCMISTLRGFISDCRR